MANSKTDPLSTLSRTNKRVDQFYVTFYNIPENISNILGAQVQSIGRPEIEFEYSKLRGRNYHQNIKHYVNFNPISVIFFDDENSVVSMFLYAQIMRQLGKHKDVFGNVTEDGNYNERKFTFDIGLEIKNPKGVTVEEYILRDCFIQTLEHSQPVVTSDDEENEITAMLNYSNVDIKVFDRFLDIQKQYDEEKQQ
jgi:hypothetical protein